MLLPIEVVAVILLVAGIAVGLLVRRARGRAERRARNLRALLEVSRQAAANLDRQQMLDVVVQAVQDVMGYQLASILLLDEAQQELVSSAISSNLRGLIPLGDRVHVSRGMVGAAVRTGQTQLANDVTRNPHYARAPGGWDPGSELSVPLKLRPEKAASHSFKAFPGNRGDAVGERLRTVPERSVGPGDPPRVVGVFDVQDRAKSAFSQDDVQVLEALGEQLVVLLEKARLFESERRRADRLATINYVGRLITANLTANVDDLLRTAMEALNTHLRFSHIALLLVDPDRPDLLVLRASSGIYDVAAVVGEYRQPMDHGVMGRAARSGRRALVNDVRADPDYLPVPGANTLRAELATPIQIGGRLLGVLNIEDEHPFTEDDATGLEIIADQLAIAIDSARLFADTQSNLERLTTLYTLSQRISLARDDLEAMRAVLEELGARSPYRCTMALFEFDPLTRKPVHFRVPFYFQPGEGVAAANWVVPASDDDLNPPLDTGQTVAIADVNSDPRVPEVLRREQAASGRPALALIPLMVGGQRIGNLILSHTEPHPWAESELQLFQSAANQIAAAIENARLFVNIQRALDETRLLYETAQRFGAAMGVDEVIEAYLDQVAVRGQHTCSVILYEFDDVGERTAVIAHAHWTPHSGLLRARDHYPNQRDNFDELLEAGQPVLVADIQADPRVPDHLRQAQALAQRPALAMIPLTVRGQCIGLVALTATVAHEWTEADLWPYQSTASQLATAIDNRRQQILLYERGQRLAVLEERQRLARDLHDSVTQLVFSITLIAQSIGPAYKRDPVEGERRIGRVLELSQQALAEMRALLTELRPASPVQNGLLSALRQHVERTAEREKLAGDKLAIELIADLYTPHPREWEEALYRVVQESLNNVIKHARANRVTIQLGPVNGALELSIADDGQGFDPAASPTAGRAPGGMGLSGMRERIERLGGAFEVQSARGEGTRIWVSLPERERRDP